MIPFISSNTYQILGITFQTWGTFVALGYALGTFVAWHRAKKKGLNPQAVLDLAFWIFIGAFIGARLFHVLFYAPSYYLAHPIAVIDPREPGFAIFGGFLGAALVFFTYIRTHKLDLFSYADALVWGLPWGVGVGRIGCFLIHDHPGPITTFFLGMRFPDGSIRHDLGLYLSLVGFATGLLFLWLNRKNRPPGFWLGAYMIMEGIVRFSLDFLRLADTRYFGLTPTQYLSIPLACIGLWFIVQKKMPVKA